MTIYSIAVLFNRVFPGACGCIWFVIWSFFATSVPGKNRFIKPEEKAYLEATLGSTTHKVCSLTFTCPI